MSKLIWYKRSKHELSTIPKVKYLPNLTSYFTTSIRQVRSTCHFFSKTGTMGTVDLYPEQPVFGVSSWTCGKSAERCPTLLICLNGSIYDLDWCNRIYDEFLIYKGIGVSNTYDYYPVFYWRKRHWTTCTVINHLDFYTPVCDTFLWLSKTSVSTNKE